MKITRRTLLSSAAAALLPGNGEAAPAISQAAPGANEGNDIPSGWSEMLVGAGGWIQQAQFANDGTCVIVTDTGAAAIGKAIASNRWIYTPVAASLPSFLETEGSPVGANNKAPCSVYALAIAPTNSQKLVAVVAGYTMLSVNQGASYSQVSNTSVPKDNTVYSNQNANYGAGPFAVFDPQNANVIVLGLPSQGIYYSHNGGSIWSKITGIAASTNTSGGIGRYCICFDPSSLVSGEYQQGVYIGVYGTGVYHSRTGLDGTFSLLSGSPQGVFQMACSADGYLSVITGKDRNIWMWDGSSGSLLTPANPNGEGNYISSCAWDPGTRGRIIAAASDGTLNVSINYGAVFTGWSVYNSFNFVDGDGIGWLSVANGAYMSAATIAFDPSQSNLLLMTAGVGVYICSPLNNYASTGVTWTSSSLGIEQLVCNKIVSNFNGDIYIASWDRPFFRINNSTYPLGYQPQSAYGSVLVGWDIDYAGSANSTVVGAIQGSASGYSTDRLSSFRQFSSSPNNTGASGGMIAVDASGVYIVYISADKHTNPGEMGSTVVGQVSYSSNNGNSWTVARMTPSQPATTPSGWGFNGSTPHTLCSDKVKAQTFYALSGLSGVYRSTNGGRTWDLQNSRSFSGYNLARAILRANPLAAGDLWAATGTQFQSHPANAPFLHSTDGGASWSQPNTNVREVLAFGFGAIKSGQSYPTLYIAGWISGAYGIWRSFNEGVTWKLLNDHATGGTWPLGILDTINWLEGDMSNYALCYVGFSGTGYTRGNFA